MTREELIKDLEDKFYITYNQTFNIKGIKNNPPIYKAILNLFSKEFRKDKSLKELIYLIYNPEKLNSKCYHPDCSNSTKFLNGKVGYSRFCSNECYTNFLKFTLSDRLSLVEASYRPLLLSKKELKQQLSFDSKGRVNPAFSKELGLNEDSMPVAVALLHYTEFLPIDAPIRERIFCIQNNISSPILCSYCNEKPVKFTKNRYADTCSQSCNSKNSLSTRQDTLMKRYNQDNPSKVPKFQKDKETTCLIKYNKKHYSQTQEFQDRYIEAIRSMTGDNTITNYTQSKEWKKKRQKQLEEQKNDPNYIHHMKDPDCVSKMFATKKKNKTTNTSSIEGRIYEDLKLAFKVVKREYKEERYPFHCDFYIEDIDLFIEYQGYWTHGRKAFNFKDSSHIDILEVMQEKAKTSEHYRNAITTWTQSDVIKRYTAYKNNLLYLEIFDYKGIDNLLLQIKRSLGEFYLKYKDSFLSKELSYFQKTEGKLQTINNKNKIVYTFNPHFFEKEINLYRNDPIKRRKLIENRCKYLNKEEHELSDVEILTGFKKSGIYYGFSHFNPLWIKYFIEKYNVSSIYDPFGGWGHRLIGACDISYIYNDVDGRSVEGGRKIAEYFGMKDKIFYNEKAENFIPKENFEAVFTCPPYFDLEDYSNEDSSHRLYSNYQDWIGRWWDDVIKNIASKCPKYIGLVLKEDLIKDMSAAIESQGYTVIEQSTVGKSSNNYLSGGSSKSNNEILVVFSNNLHHPY